MPKSDYEIVLQHTGVNSIKDLVSGEVFHPGIGPIAEARLLHVRQQKLRERAEASSGLVIWDVGLGAAGNTIAALEDLHGCTVPIEIHSFDCSRSITEFAIEHAEELVYVQPWRERLCELLERGSVQVSDKILWIYHYGDFRKTMHEAPKADVVFYDPYSSAKNQEVWTLDHLTRMRVLLNDDATLTNYSSSSAVRVTFLLAGFFVGVGVALGKKAESLFASPSQGIVPLPLQNFWLDKLPRSQSSAPIRETVLKPAPIDAVDFAELKKHPQFTLKE